MGHQHKKTSLFIILLLAILVGWHCSCNSRQDSSAHSFSAPPNKNAQPTLKYLEKSSASPQSAQASPLIVIHGLGDSPSGIATLFDNSPLDIRILYPQAPTSHGRGFSWFPVAIPVRNTSKKTLAKDVTTAATQVCSFIEAVSPKNKVIVTGFSQGGILSFSSAMICPEKIKAAIPIAGFLPIKMSTQRKEIPPITALHGRTDRVIPFIDGLNSIQKLKAQNLEASMISYDDVGHQISLRMRQDLFKIIEEYL